MPKVVESYGRKTVRLQELFGILAFALGGEVGAKTARELGLQTSGDTLLRRIRRAPTSDIESVKVLGVDAFSFRRGVRFGTILVDLEKRKPIDLLPGHESETLALWLKQHPESRSFRATEAALTLTVQTQARRKPNKWLTVGIY